MYRKKAQNSASDLPSIFIPSPAQVIQTVGKKRIFAYAILILSAISSLFYTRYYSTYTFSPNAAETRKDDLIRRLSRNNGLDSAPIKIVYKEREAMSRAHSPTDSQSVGGKPQPGTQYLTAEIESEDTALKHYSILPESSVFCDGTSKDDRTCRFKNLCYNPTHDSWFILRTNRTIQEGVPITDRQRSPLLYLSSIDNHPYFNWNFMEASPYLPELRNIAVRYEDTPHYLFKRLHPENIMHNLHDDVLNMYYQMKKYCTIASEPGRMELPFSLFAQRILLLDEYEGTGSTRPFQYLSNHPIRFGSYLRTTPAITCFREAVVGNAKTTRWYQYGFYDKPQGALERLPNGQHVREVGEWFIKRMGFPLGIDEQYPVATMKVTLPVVADNSHLDFPESDLIVILGRTRNRLILNENELATHLTAKFGYEAVILRNEDKNFEEQIKILRRARIVLGMHGSILVMAMFCRRGTVLLEMYPYAVPSNHYTPYRTMANLNGMDLVYRAWENTHTDASVGHPDRHELHGGLGKLSPEMRELVLNTTTVPQHKCCSSPFWLYRIYQDTTANVDEVVGLIKDALVESRNRVLPPLYQDHDLTKNVMLELVKEVTCIDDPSREKGTLMGSWESSWAGSKVSRWDVLVNNDAAIYTTKSNETSITIPGFKIGTDIIWFVRAVGMDGMVGEWGAAGSCKV